MSAEYGTVYDALQAHQVAQHEWTYRHVVETLQDWKKIFASEFKLEFPSVAICIGATSMNCNGYFRPKHNQFGLCREILIQERYLEYCLASKEVWRLLCTWFHELLHAWQDLKGSAGKGNFHNKEFRETALKYGLVIDARGHTDYDSHGLLFDLFNRQSIQAPTLLAKPVQLRGKSKLKKWSCCCTPPVNVRVAISNFCALCLHCKREFQLSD